jgi:serine/threonine-protein kinase
VTTQLATLLQDALGPDYRIEQELDGAGMSRVFLATDLRHERRVVVKVLSPEHASETSSARFKREIELTVRLQHPHILPILTSGATPDTLYYVSPFIPGESLRARIERDGKLPLSDVVRFLRDVSGALAFAHQRGIVHRDVKPGNILLAEGHAILADFGIARAVATNATPLTGSGMVPGTPAYMAPELPTDEKADVFALGVVGCEMLCGALPKRGITAREILAARGKVAGDSTARLSAVSDILVRALSLDVANRFSTAREFCDAIESVGSRRRAHGVRPWVIGGVVAATLVGLTYQRFRPRPDADEPSYAVVPAGDLAARDTLVLHALMNALGEWDGVTLSPLEASASPSGTPLSEDAIRRTAKRLAVRHVVVPAVRRAGDTIFVSAAVYSASGDAPRRIEATDVSPAGVAHAFANRVLREAPDVVPPVGHRPSLQAWRAYDAGRSQLRSWSLSAAMAAFRTALGADPAHALANLRLAQTRLWMGDRDTTEVLAALTRALASHELPSRDSALAAGLTALIGRD